MENERITKIAIGSKVRLATRVRDAMEGAQWIRQQIGELHLDTRNVEFGLELGTYDRPLPEVWLEGYVTGDMSAGHAEDERS
jgi:hypothetical protein